LAFYTDSETGYIINKNGDNGIRFRHREATIMQVGKSATEQFVGIGTTTPSAPLHVHNSASILAYFTRPSAGPSIHVGSSTAAGARMGYTLSYDIATFGHDAVGDAIAIKSDGRVGIGTTDPDGDVTIRSLFDDHHQVFELQAFDGNQLLNVRQSDNDCLIRGYEDGNIQRIQLHAKGVSYLTGGSVGIGTDSPGGRLDIGAGYMVNEQGRQDHVANTLPQPYYRFDGVNDEITIADTNDLSFGNGTNDTPFSMSAWINMEDATDFNIVTKNDTGLGEWRFLTDSVDRLQILLSDLSATAYQYAYTSAMTAYEGKWIFVTATYSGVGGTGARNGLSLYVNGVLQSVTRTYSGTYVAMENTAYEVRIGNLHNYTYAKGSISDLKIHNLELSATEIKELYSGASVPYKYKGSNQTKILDFDFASSSGWALTNTTISGGVFTLGSGSTSYGYKGVGVITQKGKKYAITYEIVSNNQVGGTLRVEGDVTNKIFNSNVTMPGSVGVHTVYSDAYTLGSGSIFMISLTGASSGSVAIDNVYVTRAGAVAEYDGSGMTGDTWYDKSGNNLDGDVDGPSLENRATALIVDDRVGIGTDVPTKNLHIHTDANGEGLLIKSTGNTYSDIILDSNRSTSSNLGQLIGKWNGTQVATMTFLAGDDTDNKDNGEIVFYTAAAGTVAEAMRINEAGNVGIGMTPTHQLDIAGVNKDITSGSSIIAIHSTNAFAANIGGSLGFQANTSTAGGLQELAVIVGNKETAGDGNTAGYLAIGTRPNGGAITERMRIDSAGQVGIGTNAPGAPLHIYSPNTGAGLLRIHNSSPSTGDVGGIDFYAYVDESVVTNPQAYIRTEVMNNWGSKMHFGVSPNGAATTAATTKMTLDDNGNVGIGTTGPGYLLDVNGTANATLFSGSGASLTTLDGDEISSGTVAAARLGTGASNSKFLRGDGTWQTVGSSYTLPLSADGTRGGVQIGFSELGKDYPVELSSEKMYVNVPWTDTVYGSWSVKANSGTAGAVTSGTTLDFKQGGATTVSRNGNDITISSTNTTYSVITASTGGVMADGDAVKFEGIAAGAQAGTVTSVTTPADSGLDISEASPAPSITLDLTELTDMTADIGTADEVILLDTGSGGGQRRKAFGELKLSQFNNDSGWTDSTVTSVTTPDDSGVNIANTTTTPSITLDFSEFTDLTADIIGAYEVIFIDTGSGGGQRRKAFSELKLSKFNNDSGWTSNPAVSIASSAADVLGASNGAISADDAGADKLVYWDEGLEKLKYLTFSDLDALP